MQASDPQLEALRVALNSKVWRDRKDAVDALRERLRALPDESMVASIGTWLLTHVDDVKWEVRQAIAHAAEFLFHPTYNEIIDRLANDANSHVGHRVQRTVKRRHDLNRLEERGHEQVQTAVNLVRRLRRKHGSEVADTCLEIAERMYGARFNETVHEMFTVVAGLEGLDRRLKRALGTEAPAKWSQCTRIAEEMAEQHSLLERFIHDARDFLRYQEPQRERVKLAEAVETALKRLKAAGFGAMVYIEVPKTLHVVVPQHRFIEALCSLLKNAFEALDDAPGDVRIHGQPAENQRVRLTIVDTGCGMSKDDLSGAFKSGITSKTRVGKNAHTGFGLPLARKIIERECRGTFELESTPGRGTTVSMELPTRREIVEESL